MPLRPDVGMVTLKPSPPGPQRKFSLETGGGRRAPVPAADCHAAHFSEAGVDSGLSSLRPGHASFRVANVPRDFSAGLGV
jgi:hypothetical protein